LIARFAPLAAAPVARQFARFGAVGLLVSAIGGLFYAVPAGWLGVAPLIATFISYGAALAAGFILHGRLSFAGHGRRDRPARQGARFFLVSLVGLGLNSLFVAAMTGPLGLAPLWPLVPMALVTPLVTFWLNRAWVYR
jgi:putative flippase GtrA